MDIDVHKLNKVITTKVTRLLNDHTYCARSAFTHLGVLAKAVRLFMPSLYNQPIRPKCALLTFSTTYNQLTEIRKEDFPTAARVGRLGGGVGSRDGPIQWLAHGFLLAPNLPHTVIL